MALIVKEIGWNGARGDPDRKFEILLVAETEEDIPNLNLGVIFNKTPMTLHIVDEDQS